MALKIDVKFERKLACAFKNDMKNLVNFRSQTEKQRFHFRIESKMADLNQNQNSKQPDPPDAVWKLHFTLKINEQHN